MTVEKLVYGGDGLARLDGRVVLAPFVLPGERVRVSSETEKPGLVRARPLEVLAPSAERVAPPCPYFGVCGGCHYQHAPYEYQLRLKRAILEEELRRLAKIEPPAEIEIVSAGPWSYRNRAQFHFRRGRVGYLRPRSHKLCPVRSCPIASPRVNEVLAVLEDMLRDPRWPRFLHSLEVFTDETQVQLEVVDSERPLARRFFEWCAQRVPGFVAESLDYPAAGEVFRVSRGSFFQVNRFLIDRLVEAALAPSAGETALDVYAGVGLFAVPLARRFRKVAAVESGSSAVKDLRWNAERAGVAIETAHTTAEAYLERCAGAPDFVLLDPPRAGLGKSVVAQLARLRPPRIAIVACDPATLARDLAALAAASYTLEKLALVDLFPQTFHMEVVAHLAAAA